MTKLLHFVTGISLAVLAAAASPAAAQSDIHGNVIAAPDYDSGVSAGSMSDANFNTPESDGRPGVKFFIYGVRAFRKGDYAHAINMYKVAASWAYKPAEYDLGLMYFKGQGVPVNRPLGAAWMVLAAERGGPLYIKARDAMVTLLTNSQFAETDKLWGELKATYGDKVALRRAKVRWAWVKTHRTGTRVGGATGELSVGVMDMGHAPSALDASGRPVRTTTTGSGMMQGGSVDGSIAYRQLQESDDPYSPIFLKNPTGITTIGPLTPIHTNDETAKKDRNTPSSSSDQSQKPT